MCHKGLMGSLFCFVSYPGIPEKIIFFNIMAIKQRSFRKNFAMMRNRLKLDLNNSTNFCLLLEYVIKATSRIPKLSLEECHLVHGYLGFINMYFANITLILQLRYWIRFKDPCFSCSLEENLSCTLIYIRFFRLQTIYCCKFLVIICLII